MVTLDDFGWNWGTCTLMDVPLLAVALWNASPSPLAAGQQAAGLRLPPRAVRWYSFVVAQR